MEDKFDYAYAFTAEAEGEAVELGDDEAIRFEEAKRCVRIQQPAQKKTPRQVKKTEKGNA